MASSDPPVGRRWQQSVSRLTARLEGAVDEDPGPRASSERGGGNVSGRDYVGVTLGKSVCVLTTSDAYKSLCRATVGKSGTVVCFKPAAHCSVDSHLKQRTKRTDEDDPVFPPGIYVRAPGGDAHVFNDVVGPISLMSAHESTILDHEEKDKTAWPSFFNLLARSQSSADAKVSKENVRAAKLAQTPAKMKAARPDLDVKDFHVPMVDIPDLEAWLGEYEESWRASADTEGLLLPATFKVSQFLSDIHTSQLAFAETLADHHRDISDVREWSNTEGDLIGSRITDLESSIGAAPFDWRYGTSLWSSMAGIATILEDKPTATALADVRNQSNRHEMEFQTMFEAHQALGALFEQKMRTAVHRIDQLEGAGPALGAAPGADPALLSQLLDRIEKLEKKVELGATTIANLESRLESGVTASFNIDSRHTVRCAADVEAYLTKMGATDIDFGGFCDVFNIFSRLEMKIAGSGTVAEFVKKKKDSLGINLSEDETLVVYSFQDGVPGMLGGVKTDKSDIAKLQTPEKWKNKGAQSGMYYDIKTYITAVEKDIKSIIILQFSDHPSLDILATKILTTATSFLSSFLAWVDSTFEVLVEGGNTRADVWNLCAKVMRAIFEEGIAPHRTTPTGSTFSSSLQRTSVMLWGVLRTHMVVAKMEEQSLSDNPIVTGSYSKWLVNNSGKKDAIKIAKDLTKLETTVSAIKETMATKKALATVEKAAEAAKKTADRAMSRQ